jgi:hypothetical protein
VKIGAVMINSAGKAFFHMWRQDQVALNGMEVSAGGVHAERPGIFSVRFPSGKPQREFKETGDIFESERP